MKALTVVAFVTLAASLTIGITADMNSAWTFSSWVKLLEFVKLRCESETPDLTQHNDTVNGIRKFTQNRSLIKLESFACWRHKKWRRAILKLGKNRMAPMKPLIVAIKHVNKMSLVEQVLIWLNMYCLAWAPVDSVSLWASMACWMRFSVLPVTL